MWEKLFDLMTKVFTLSTRVDRLEKDIEQLRQDNKQLLNELSRQKSQIDVLVYALQSETDKTQLWVEKKLAEFERRLPSGEDKKSKKK